MNTRLFTTLFAMLVLLIACSKKNETDPKPNPQTPGPKVSVDDIVGTYTGVQQHHKIIYAYGGGQSYYKDTSYTTNDTLTVMKIGSDSFTLSNNFWSVYGVPFTLKFDTSNIYTLKNPTSSGAAQDTVQIRFDLSADSMVIHKFEGTTGTSAYHRYTNRFLGKK